VAAFGATDIRWDGDHAVLWPLGYAVAGTAIATLVTRIAVPARAVFDLAGR
jgi:hypothetical protein